MARKSNLINLFCGIVLCIGASNSQAAEIEVEYSDLGKLIYPVMIVYVSGEIVPGDAERIKDAIDQNLRPQQRGIRFAFDSPGGNLLEGVRIGRLIAARSELTTSLVGTPAHPSAVCASACVFAYLGAETREKSAQGLIGLHQFSMEQNDMKGEEALGLGQQMSAIVASYLADINASAAIFDRMVLTEPGAIDWVSDADLLELGIVGGGVIHQSSEFINNDGQAALQMNFMSSEGAHTLVIGCNNPGIYMVASIVAHDDSGEFHGVALILDDKRVNPAHVEFVGFKDRKIVLLFIMSLDLAIQAARSHSIGAYYYSEDFEHWFGNMQEIDRDKFLDIVTSCTS